MAYQTTLVCSCHHDYRCSNLWRGCSKAKLSINSEKRYFFYDDNPHLLFKEAFEERYTNAHNILIIVAPKNQMIFTSDTLAAVEELTALSWDVPNATRVDSITNFQHTRADGDELIFEEIVVDASLLSRQQLDVIRERSLSETLLVNRLISPIGHVTGINITINKPEKTDDITNQDIVEYSQRMVSKAPTEMLTRGTGEVILGSYISERNIRSMMVATFGALILISVILIAEEAS